MTAATESPAATPRPASPAPALRVAVAIGLTALVLIAALNVGLGGAVGAMFGGAIGGVTLLVVPVATAGAIALVVFACTGRRRIGAAIIVTVLAFASLGLAIFGFGTVPMLWVEPGFELVYPLIAVPCALTLGLFLGGWRPRIVGLIGVALLVAGGIWVAIPDAQPEVVSQEQQQIDANFEYFVAQGEYPMVADLPGGTIVGVAPDGGPPRILSVSADGGVVEAVTDRNAIATNPDTAPCWYLAESDASLEDTDTMEDYASWCIRDGDVWRLTDGTGYARMENGSLVAVRSAISQNLRDGDRAATADEVMEAWDTLRPMTEAEVRRYLQNA